VNIRTVKYSFALSLPREVAAAQLLPSPSLNPVRSALPGSFQIEFDERTAAAVRNALAKPEKTSRWSLVRVRIMLPFVVTATLFTDNVATELMIPGSSAIREVIRKRDSSRLEAERLSTKLHFPELDLLARNSCRVRRDSG
jgi:hypothetical protein